MENGKDLERWVNDHLAGLSAPAKWQPDAARAYRQLAEVDRAKRRRRHQRLLGAAVGAAALLAVVLIEAPKAYCAATGCTKQAPAPGTAAIPEQLPLQPAAPSMPSKPTPTRKTPRPAPNNQQWAPINFKEVGAAGAPITCEIYRDLECPPCAAAFRDVMLPLTADYVRTGKVRLIYRDLPLLHHPYAGLAARYANAAGRLGEYDKVVAQIFRTQAAWSAKGDIDTQVAEVLTPGVMQRLREMVKNDATLDDSVAADQAMARQDHITMTPSIVVVKNDHHEVLSPVPSYELLKAYLDRLLAEQ